MKEISDTDLRAIVERVVRQATGYGYNVQQAGSTPSAAQTPAPVSAPAPASQTDGGKRVAIGSDHGGYDLKELLKKDLGEQGYVVIDVGTYNKEACDYPDLALAVAQQVAAGKAWRGIMIDGAGIGSCMAANKVPGVRAGMAYDVSSASNGREHNNANLLTLGAGLVGANLAKQIVKVWLETEFGGGRHAKRVDKITAIEKQFLK